MKNLILIILLFLSGHSISAQDIYVKKLTVIGDIEKIELVKLEDEDTVKIDGSIRMGDKVIYIDSVTGHLAITYCVEVSTATDTSASICIEDGIMPAVVDHDQLWTDTLGKLNWLLGNADPNIKVNYKIVMEDTSGNVPIDGKLITDTIQAKDANGLYLLENDGKGIHIKDTGNVAIWRGKKFDFGNGGSGDAYLEFRTLQLGEPSNYAGTVKTYNTNLILRPGSNSNLLVKNYSNDTNLVVTNAGDVGIGVSNPSEKLEVNGNIKGDTLFGNGSNITGYPLSIPFSFTPTGNGEINLLGWYIQTNINQNLRNDNPITASEAGYHSHYVIHVDSTSNTLPFNITMTGRSINEASGVETGGDAEIITVTDTGWYQTVKSWIDVGVFSCPVGDTAQIDIYRTSYYDRGNINFTALGCRFEFIPDVASWSVNPKIYKVNDNGSLTTIDNTILANTDTYPRAANGKVGKYKRGDYNTSINAAGKEGIIIKIDQTNIEYLFFELKYK